eukprot:TRINITY_DN3414_c0_g1_i1.p1 TRINITY_DN3414_c0_g1~~TRINITY_DN3414_c0_g1_i1.p1  ORF type:complete len:539 (+),score=162.14 TRINITY_DN3414_c0_g1_i1:53-1618(+)
MAACASPDCDGVLVDTARGSVCTACGTVAVKPELAAHDEGFFVLASLQQHEDQGTFGVEQMRAQRGRPAGLEERCAQKVSSSLAVLCDKLGLTSRQQDGVLETVNRLIKRDGIKDFLMPGQSEAEGSRRLGGRITQLLAAALVHYSRVHEVGLTEAEITEISGLSKKELRKFVRFTDDAVPQAEEPSGSGAGARAFLKRLVHREPLRSILGAKFCHQSMTSAVVARRLKGDIDPGLYISPFQLRRIEDTAIRIFEVGREINLSGVSAVRSQNSYMAAALQVSATHHDVVYRMHRSEQRELVLEQLLADEAETSITALHRRVKEVHTVLKALLLRHCPERKPFLTEAGLQHFVELGHLDFAVRHLDELCDRHMRKHGRKRAASQRSAVKRQRTSPSPPRARSSSRPRPALTTPRKPAPSPAPVRPSPAPSRAPSARGGSRAQSARLTTPVKPPPPSSSRAPSRAPSVASRAPSVASRAPSVASLALSVLDDDHDDAPRLIVPGFPPQQDSDGDDYDDGVVSE